MLVYVYFIHQCILYSPALGGDEVAQEELPDEVHDV